MIQPQPVLMLPQQQPEYIIKITPFGHQALTFTTAVVTGTAVVVQLVLMGIFWADQIWGPLFYNLFCFFLYGWTFAALFPVAVDRKPLHQMGQFMLALACINILMFRKVLGHVVLRSSQDINHAAWQIAGVKNLVHVHSGNGITLARDDDDRVGPM